MKTFCRFAAIASAVGLVGTAQAIEYELDGTIQEVDDSAKKITVELEESGDVVTYKVNDDTDINFAFSTESGFDELRAGQEVTLTFDDEVLEEEWILIRYLHVS